MDFDGLAVVSDVHDDARSRSHVLPDAFDVASSAVRECDCRQSHERIAVLMTLISVRSFQEFFFFLLLLTLVRTGRIHPLHLFELRRSDLRQMADEVHTTSVFPLPSFAWQLAH